MKVLILAAGYGTRLARDLEQSDQYQELRGLPKPLLPIGGIPLMSRWMKLLEACPQTFGCEVFVVVNNSNQEYFNTWAIDYPRVQLVSDGTKCNEERLGAVACIGLAVRHFKINDDLIVIGGYAIIIANNGLILLIIHL